jgi:hypothetical protein
LLFFFFFFFFGKATKEKQRQQQDADKMSATREAKMASPHAGETPASQKES